MTKLIPELNIDHFSYAIKETAAPICGEGFQNKYIHYNIVFSVNSEYDNYNSFYHYLKYISNEFKKTVAWSANKFKKFKCDENSKFEDLPAELIYEDTEIFIQNDEPYITYLEKFNKFQAREYVSCNPITVACIDFLECLYTGQEDKIKDQWRGITAYDGQFLRVLETLDEWWD